MGPGQQRCGARSAIKEADRDIIQTAGRYTLLEQPALDELFPLCAERDIPVMVGDVYNSGILAGGNRYDYTEAAPDMIAKRDRIQRICVGHGVDIRAAALRFGAAHPAVSTVLAGGKYPERAREKAGFMCVAVPSALWQELKGEGKIFLPASVPWESVGTLGAVLTLCASMAQAVGSAARPFCSRTIRCRRTPSSLTWNHLLTD
ncbi:aldo/keto reductase [Streptomyces sp. NBC_01451]